ncbi:MAG: DUF975 family protein [Eubacteriales bacterium]|nr:DUF975 family protein [Eubacteriales bacterium]
MINRKEMKSLAKTQIKGRIGMLFLCQFIISLIISASSTFIVGVLLVPSFSISTILIYLALTKNISPSVNDIWKGFNVFGKAVWLNIITGFFVFLWSLLFMVPGIVKTFAYSMAPYILAENSDMTAREALAKSKRLTDGHKGELFVLSWSFIGWYLLIPLTLGLIMIWLVPYVNATSANFYLAMKEQKRD